MVAARLRGRQRPPSTGNEVALLEEFFLRWESVSSDQYNKLPVFILGAVVRYLAAIDLPNILCCVRKLCWATAPTTTAAAVLSAFSTSRKDLAGQNSGIILCVHAHEGHSKGHFWRGGPPPRLLCMHNIIIFKFLIILNHHKNSDKKKEEKK